MAIRHSPLLPSDLATLTRDLNLRLAEINEITSMLHRGIGTPEGLVAAPVGALYQRTDGGTGTSVYRKETGAGKTGWIALSAGSGGGGTNPLTTVDLVDEFMGGRGGGTGSEGDLGWERVGVPMGSTSSDDVVNHPGVLSIDTAVPFGVSQHIGLRLNYLESLEMFDVTYVVRPAFNGLNDAAVGFGDVSLLDFTGGNVFSIRSNNSNGSFWHGEVRSTFPTVKTVTTSLAIIDPLATLPYYALRLRRIDSTTVGFSVDGGTELTLPTISSTRRISPRIEIASGNEVEMFCKIDLVHLKITGLTR